MLNVSSDNGSPDTAVNVAGVSLLSTMLRFHLRDKHTGEPTGPEPTGPTVRKQLIQSPHPLWQTSEQPTRWTRGSPSSLYSDHKSYSAGLTPPNQGQVLPRCGVPLSGAPPLEPGLLSEGWLGWVLFKVFFSPNSPNIKGKIPVKGGLEAYRTAWVREVLDPELVPSDDSALRIFSFVNFLCMTADDQLWASRDLLSPDSRSVTGRKSPKWWTPAWLFKFSLSFGGRGGGDPLVECVNHQEEDSTSTAFFAASAHTLPFSLVLCEILFRIPTPHFSSPNVSVEGRLGNCGPAPGRFLEISVWFFCWMPALVFI